MQCLIRVLPPPCSPSVSVTHVLSQGVLNSPAATSGHQVDRPERAVGMSVSVSGTNALSHCTRDTPAAGTASARQVDRPERAVGVSVSVSGMSL